MTCAERVQNSDFVTLLNGFKTWSTPGSDRRVPDPNAFSSFDNLLNAVRSQKSEEGAGLGDESATSGLDLCGMQRDLGTVVSF